MRIPRLLQAVLVMVGVYLGFIVGFDVVLGQVIPSSLLTMYMFFVAAGVFMTFTYDDERTRELVAPIKALVEDPSRRWLRNLVFTVVPLAAGAATFVQMQPSFDAPVEQVMYLDSPLKEHTLLQAIARVNRPADGKDYGLVVDYWGVSDALQEALAISSRPPTWRAPCSPRPTGWRGSRRGAPRPGGSSGE